MIREAFDIIFSFDVFGGLIVGMGCIAVISEFGNKFIKGKKHDE